MNKSIIFSILLSFSSLSILAQYNANITGPDNVNVGEQHVYGTSVSGATSYDWRAFMGTIMSESSFSATIKWNEEGTGRVNFDAQTFNGFYTGVKYVTIVGNNPPKPNATFTILEECSKTTITRSYLDPNEDYEWYWQTSSSGEDLSNKSSNLEISTSQDVYLRARYKNSPNNWSEAQYVGFINVTSENLDVPSPLTAKRIGTGDITLEVNPIEGASRYYWYDANDGFIQTTTSPRLNRTISNTTTFKVASLKTCLSEKAVITAEVAPEPEILQTNCGVGVEQSVTLSLNFTYDSYTWKKESMELGSSPSIISNNTGLYSVTVNYGTQSSAELLVIDNQLCANQNMIITDIIKTPNIYEESEIANLNVDNKNRSIVYFDGLGRPIQEVSKKISPGKQDIVSITEYDNLGRKAKNYLPYIDGADGNFKMNANSNQADFYSTSLHGEYNNGVKTDTDPYTNVLYESSPLNRPLKTGLPGADFQPNLISDVYDKTDHSIKYRYLSNNNADGVINFTISNDNIVNNGIYSIGELYKNVIIDEHGFSTVEFKDAIGNTILKRVQYTEIGDPDNYNSIDWAETYYVYDDFGNLRFVIPPEATKQVINGNPLDNNLLNEWVFQYKYDGLQRMIEKKVPGSGWIFMVYDSRDRLVLTQDAEQRKSNEWLFTKYDHWNRPILTGTYLNNATNQIAMQAEVDQYYLNNPDNFSESKGITVHGYTNISFPTVGDESDYLTVTYYDDYDFPGAATYAFQSDELNSSSFDRVKGQITATKTRSINDPVKWYYTVNHYDDKYRVIQTQIQNHLGGNDIISTEYDFIGQVLRTKMIHNDGTQTLTINESYNYDHAGRLLSTIHQVNNETPVTLAANEYNSLGELIEKNLHQRQGENTYLQSVDFRYNIRGWLTSINDASLGNTNSNNSDTQYEVADIFGMNLGYNESIGTGIDPSLLQYNGNISAMKWNSATKGSEMSYDYTYDAMNRIKKADSDIDDIAKAYNLDVISYDLNGNILKLDRMDGQGTGMDLMTYTYDNGNQLKGVTDAGTEEGFKDGNNSNNDYDYDANGNMIADRNKDITKITYNHLNLPEEVWFDATGSKKIVYTYDAAGIKLKKEVFESGASTKTTTYIGGFIYEEGKLQQITHAEGRVVPGRDENGNILDYKYQYHHKDHLGNVRMTYGETNQTDIYLATMETESGVTEREESQFGNLETREVSGLGNTTTQQTYIDNKLDPLPVEQIGEALKLNFDNPIGSTIAITVDPGDIVNISAQGFHENLPDGDNNLDKSILITELVAAFNPAATGIGESSSQIEGALNSQGASPYIGEGTFSGPGAYLTYLYFDTDFNFITGGFIGLDANQKDMRFAPLEFNQTGYLYIYTSYESSNTSWRVYFDDVRIEVNKKIEIIQSEDYYPFGLTFNEYQRRGFRENKFLYNGKELQDDFDLNWMDYGARMYDAEIGRFNRIDRYSNIFSLLSPYNYTANNPINFKDKNGDYIIIHTSNSEGHAYSVLYENGKAYNYTIGEKGKITKEGEYDGNSKFIKNAVKDLNSVSSTDKGGEVVSDLVQSNNQYNIMGTSILEASRFEYKENNIIYSQNGGYADGVSFDKSYYALGHELLHAWDKEHTNDRYFTSKYKGYALTELNAVKFENYLRAKAGEKTMRVNYGNSKIMSRESPNYYLNISMPLRRNESLFLPKYRNSLSSDATSVNIEYKALKIDTRTNKFILD
ncbi:DUF6443 domain-containing protein [Mangrovivirga cuniculi]|uniref:DUF6443 domain-containing protein n=1 Tax=Mangrovivirga cuniculi TaxID=2715131 RepID=A0A4D7JWN2_9BACT|nr:DUF6443 domain-containing protein [Mangrovivirga cuniculi]QCK15215.1 hypothetical protein DCC35_10895 [Mangrovivirga cuniculi]